MSVNKNIRTSFSYFISQFLSDKIYLSLKFRSHMGYWMDWNNPKTYSEKLQWLKIHDRHEEYTRLVDKNAVKSFVSEKIGEEYVIPTLAVYNSAEDIDFKQLPRQFVIKCTHDSGGVVVCKDKALLDIHAAKDKLTRGLKRTFINQNREYPYANVPRKLIAEQYLEDEYGELRDYKIFCFDGEPKLLFVASDRMDKSKETKFDFFDLEWNHLPFTNGHPNSEKIIEKPKNFDKMVEIAAILSKGFPHVRVDLYNCNGKIYFGELTFFHWSGIMPFDPPEWDLKLGELLHLPSK